MGNCNLKADDSDSCEPISRSHFQFHYPIGKGGFGKVWRVTYKKTKQIYALKQMLKARVFLKRSVHSVMNERKLLALLRHPLIINIVCAFQDKENLYLLMEHKQGGDLRYHVGRQRHFSEEQTKFFVACLLVCLEYLHANNIIHRDIKPENLVLDELGYLYLTDFGIARIWQPENANETSGTPGYMAPEVLCRQNYTNVVDFFAIGVMVYEFMNGKRPYIGKNRKEIRDAILAKQVKVTSNQLSDAWSPEAIDFCNRLLMRKPNDRLGYNGIHEVVGHPWIRDYNWEGIRKRTAAPAFLPFRGDNFDSRQVLNEWRDQSELSQIKDSSLAGLFSGYFYDFQNSQLQTTGLDSTHSMLKQS